MPKPDGCTEGRIIHYVPADHELRYAQAQELRPHVAGVIVRAWNDHGGVNATIFPDGGNTGLKDEALVLWRTSIGYDPAGAPGTWHYPTDDKRIAVTPVGTGG